MSDDRRILHGVLCVLVLFFSIIVPPALDLLYMLTAFAFRSAYQLCSYIRGKNRDPDVAGQH